jgi:hypothetical protein
MSEQTERAMPASNKTKERAMFKFDWDRDDCEGSRFDVARGIILSALFGAAFWLFIVFVFSF